MLIESHIHLSHHSYDGEFPCIGALSEGICHETRESLIVKMKEAGIGWCLEPAIDTASNEKLLELHRQYPDFVLPAVGVHPTRVQRTPKKDRKLIEKYAGCEGVVAIGELGLDYHHPRWEQRRLRQKDWFYWQLKLADRLKLPLILHIRMADKDAVRLLRRFRGSFSGGTIYGGVCHCFNRGPKWAKIYTEEFGFLLGIGGSLLQKDCADLEETVRVTPLEALLLETDGPYVKPAAYEGISGKQWKKARNSSLILKDVAARIAELKGVDTETVERVTSENANRLFVRDNR